MRDDRKHQRAGLENTVVVLDDNNQSITGVVTDVSINGLRVRCTQSVEDLTFFQCKLVLPQRLRGHDEITFSARSMWCKQARKSDDYEIGLKIFRISERALGVLSDLVGVKEAELAKQKQ